jgi:NAD-dependent deacetylase
MDPKTKPNKAHMTLAKWEKEGRLKAVVTQNIDGLHQAAGSRNVMELHGSVMRNTCERCGKHYNGMEAVRMIAQSREVPVCGECGGRIKPDVVLYEESLDMDTMESAVSFIRNADVLIIGGTSLAVYPAAGLIDYYRGNKLILINKSTTPRDGQADLVIAMPIGEVLSAADAAAGLKGRA